MEFEFVDASFGLDLKFNPPRNNLADFSAVSSYSYEYNPNIYIYTHPDFYFYFIFNFQVFGA